LEFEQLSVTASLGASSLCQSPRDPQELLDQADKSLYVAKQSGRNRVVRWDEVPDQMESVETTHECKEVEQRQDDSSSIPFSAVTALMTAMAYRDHETAAHCRRVADLCIATAEGILPLKDCYVLEIAALLHDIGKIGVPDAILLKPGALNDEEWRIMRGHEQIGVQIVSNSFQCPALSRIVESYRTRFESTRSRRASDGGQPLSIEARILAIAEAYDAMTTSRIYRKGRSSQEALNELKRCAGTQFDPELVERFTQVIHARQVGTTCNVEQVSPEAILSIGTQLERLMQLLNSHDLSEVQALAQRLSSTALKIGISPIASKARELEAYANSEKDYVELIRVANELLDLCRQAQSSTLHSEAVGHG
jgi:HD-GYP domain-containing protein (c-di-GMP phosphodiesterase class II)